MSDKRQINIDDSQVGVVGDHAHIEGGICFQKIIYEGVKPVSAGDLLEACQAQVKSILYDVRHKYDPDLYVNRAIERELTSFFDTPLDQPGPNCYLIVAPAGSGKTNLLCDLARVRASQQPVLLLLGGNTYLGGTTGLLGAVKEELEVANSTVAFRSAGDSLHTLDRLAEEMGRDALLFLDAINEHDRPAAMRQALENLFRKTRNQRVKLVVTCRDYYWGLFKGQFWKGATVNDLPSEVEFDEDEETEAEGFSRFAADEHERALDLYLEHYQISGRPVGDAAEQCRHPLLLRFFCEAYRGQEVGEVEDIRLKELFDRYWAQKLVSIAERMIKQGDERLQDGLAGEVGDYLLDVAAYMLHNNVRAVPLAEMAQATQLEERYNDPRSIYGRIRDEFIILEEKERGKDQRKTVQVAFVYEEFMEYVMARSLLRDWNRDSLDEAGILQAVETLTKKYEDFVQILGVVVYVALMLKEERDLALWTLLLEQGERWQDVVFEAFRKLPEDQIDSSVFDALAQMLRTGDQEVQKQVLDYLKLNKIKQVEATSVPLVNLICELTKHDSLSIARRAALVLSSMPPDLVTSTLVEALDHPRGTVRKNALIALRSQKHLTRVTFLLLLDGLMDPSESVRKEAPKTLSHMLESKETIALLKELKASGELYERGIINRLVNMLQEANPESRKVAAQVLGHLGEKQAVDLLIKTLLNDSMLDVRQAAACALREIGDKEAIQPLIAALKQPDQGGSRTTHISGSKTQKIILTYNYSVYLKREICKALARLGEGAVEPLVALVDDNRFWTRFVARLKGTSHRRIQFRAALALGMLGDERAIEPLIAALRDHDLWVWEMAIHVLVEIGDAAVVPLLDALEQNDPMVRMGAAIALGELEDKRAIEPLINMLEEADVLDLSKIVSPRIIKTLGTLGDERAVDPLIDLLEAVKDDSEQTSLSAYSGEELQKLAVEALHQIGTPKALAALREYQSGEKIESS